MTQKNNVLISVDDVIQRLNTHGIPQNHCQFNCYTKLESGIFMVSDNLFSVDDSDSDSNIYYRKAKDLNQNIPPLFDITNFPLPFQKAIYALCNHFKIDIPEFDLVLTDAPGITDTLIKYQMGLLKVDYIFKLYENLFSSKHIPPSTSINMLIFVGWDLFHLINNDESLDFDNWKNKLKGDLKKYSLISLSMGRLFTYHHMGKYLKEYGEINQSDTNETNFMRFQNIWIQIMDNLIPILKDDGDEVLFNLGDLLSCLKDYLQYSLADS